MKMLGKLASLLVLVGAVNWGLVGLLNFDAIEYVLGPIWLDRLVYILIGAAGIFKIVNLQKNLR